MRALAALFTAALLIYTSRLQAADPLLPGVQRIVFLGDSITYAGHYIDYFEAVLFTRFPERKFEVINLGLPSETVSGLSEPGHADGKFPRPTLHERLDRVLAKTKPDLVFACYGMNDGIYLPPAEERFAKFRDGMVLLHDKVTAAGAKIIHLTPPTFDPGPHPTSDKPNYNITLDGYSAWLLEQRAKGWQVFDIHTPMNQEIATRRAADPDFFFAKDGVHIDARGHWVIARELLRNLGLPATDFTTDPRYQGLLKTLRQRGRIFTAAWLSETGHVRPGIAKGLPLEQARKDASELEAEIRKSAAAIGKQSGSGVSPLIQRKS